MKYIRIGNEIKKVAWESGKCLAFEGKSKKEFYPISKNKVDKFADDLIYLLDKAVIITTFSPTVISHELWNDKRTAIEVFDENQRRGELIGVFSRCMGAVWTDDGLRYVAEYKDGRWELL